MSGPRTVPWQAKLTRVAIGPIPPAPPFPDREGGRGLGRRARDAVTIYRALATPGGYTLVEAEPQTGRTHQIRIHLAFLGFPVVADAVYGKKKNALGLTRQFLHAWKITFTLPRDGRAVSFVAPLAEELQKALGKLGFAVSDS